MDNPEYTFSILELYSKITPKEIPVELEEYISYVARTGESVFQWGMVKTLIKKKLLAVLDDFMESNPNFEIPPCPNVDPFNFETMKTNLLSRLDSFLLAPFTIQRICELLSAPRKEYNRLDKYMRAVEKNVLVVSASDLSMSASDLSIKRSVDGDNDAVINGILYDKVTDSVNNVTHHDHIFMEAADIGEFNESTKLDETDAVQQIIEESWTDDNHGEFKINGGPSSSTLSVNFESELQFVTDKACEEKTLDVSNKEDSDDSSYGNSSMLLDSSLQNIIGETSTIAFDNVSKSDDSFESKNDDTYEFKSDSICESELSSTSETEVETATFGDKSIENTSQVDDGDVSSTIAVADLSETTKKDDGNENEETNPEYSPLSELKSDNVVSESQLDVEKEDITDKYSNSVSDGNDSREDDDASSTVEDVKKLDDIQNTNEENVESSIESCDSSFNSVPEISATTQDSKNEITSTEEMEVDQTETKFSCGDIGRDMDVDGNPMVLLVNDISEVSRSDEPQSGTASLTP